MPAGPFSRHFLCQTLVDAEGRVFYGERSRYYYRELTDNSFYTVTDADSIFTIAANLAGICGLSLPCGETLRRR